MLFFVIAGAVAVDAFATGMWIGKKWGTSSAAAAVGADIAAVAAKVSPVVSVIEADVSKVVSALEADVAALRAKVTPASATSVAPTPVTPVAGAGSSTSAPVQTALQAQAANAPK